MIIKCCICSKINVDKNDPVWCQLDVTVPWKYPVWGNFIRGISSQGMAVICNYCNSRFTNRTSVKEVVEFDGNQVNYHPITWIDGKPELKTK